MNRAVRLQHVRLGAGARDMTSIIIPCFNGVMYTRRCIQSIIAATRSPYELILIDNGSPDATGEYFAALAHHASKRKLPSLRALRFIRNKKNRGVSGALNQGILRSKGRYICYLNNDTVVADGWIDALRRQAERDTMIGIVGCCSGFRRGAVESFSIPWTQLEKEIRRVAAYIALKHRGEYEPARYIHGFCMFMKRKVVTAIGLFDEGFYPCSGEDFDYSIRARAAGFSLIIARDVLVYHFLRKATTSRHFNAAYGAIEGIAAEAYERLIEKWGKEGERCYLAP